MTLRDYQKEAYDSVISHCRKSLTPALIEAPTGSGKSHIIASIAKKLNEESNKRILCVAPSAELVEQNHAKFIATGNPASIYSASINKSLKHPVIFGTPLSILNDIKKFKDQFCAVIIDEAHKTTRSILDIISKLKSYNDKLRVIGLTATPQRLGSGLIYGDDKMYKLVHSISPYDLIKRGYLCDTEVIYPSDENYYHTLHFKLNKHGSFMSENLHDIEISHEKTANIIHDVVSFSEQKNGITIIFATTVKHAKEIFLLLPQWKSLIITNETKNRKALINKIKAGLVKYIVNVQVLTTGFDAPNINVIALLRPTESKTLLQQMIGRGLRTAPLKEKCYVLDYAENIKRHCKDDRDIFSVEKEIEKNSKESKPIEVTCPDCHHVNAFAALPNPDRLKISKSGYFMTLTSEETEVPAHLGRRCNGLVSVGNNEYKRCAYRWSGKECDKCGHDNDITARDCEKCGHELINPDSKLNHSRFTAYFVVEKVTFTYANSKKGNPIRIVKFSNIVKEITVFFMLTNDFWFKKKVSEFDKAYAKGILKIKYEIRKGFVNILEYITK